MRAVENQPSVVPEKTQNPKLWDRRKFLSRSFIGGSMVLAGTAGISRSLTELAVDHYKEIPSEIAQAARETPSFVADAIRSVDDIPAGVKNAAVYVRDEISSTGIENKTCVIEDGDYIGIANSRELELPFIQGNVPCNRLHVELYDPFLDSSEYRSTELTPDKPWKPKTKLDAQNDTNDAPPHNFRMTIGSVMLAAGALVLRSSKEEKVISRRKFLTAAGRGVAAGTIYTGVDVARKIF